MADSQDNSRVPDMTVNDMREWLRNWIGNATGQSPDSINESTPMVELGLSSRDAVAMASDIERGMAAGFFRYLTKPVDIDRFNEAIDGTLAQLAAGKGQET